MGYYEIKIVCHTETKEILIALLNSFGANGFIDNEDTLITYFRDIKGADFIRDVLSQITQITQLKEQPTYTYLSERDWNETWKKRFEPITIGQNLAIIPPWQEKVEGKTNIIIDPAMAFGTGHHETTQRCLYLIEKYIDKTNKKGFMDLGTGSGILAITARILGFQDVVAIDNDILAIEATTKNLEANNLTDVTVIHADISHAKGLYDMVTANLILNVIRENTKNILNIVRRAGFLIISGLIDGQGDEIIDIMQKQKMQLLDIYQDGRWSTMIFKKD
ncbi:MAG: 50S ribosomal protein L11 methyltransferase [Thermodesulfovibrionales bacterium]|nr:50S ribosomal protein L11 methyltransferase [Thermodesulfovibrionales bacterium]